MNEMGKRINQRRTALGYTMEELAKKVGVQSSAVNKWEKGIVSNIPQSRIKKIADALECSPVWLMGIDATTVISNYYIDETTAKMANLMKENPEYQVLFDASSKVKPEDIEKVAQMIKIFNGED